jgi:hypothetical protein
MFGTRKQLISISIVVIAIIASIVVLQTFGNYTLSNDTSKESREAGAKSLSERAKHEKKLPNRSAPRKPYSIDAAYNNMSNGIISADEAWQEIDADSRMSPAQKISTKGMIIRKIAKTKGATSALEFLNSHVGPGTLRARLLWPVFDDACNNLPEAAKALSKLEFPAEELRVAIDGIASSYVVNQRHDFDPSSLINHVPSSALPGIAKSIIFSLGRDDSGNKEEINGQVINVFESLKDCALPQDEKNDALKEVFSALSADFPGTAWQILSQQKGPMPEYMHKNASQLIANMVAANPSEALNSIIQYNGESREELVQTAAYSIARRDMAEVTKVLQSVKGADAQIFYDAYATGVIKYSVEVNDLRSAADWLASIKGENERLRAEKFLNSR